MRLRVKMLVGAALVCPMVVNAQSPIEGQLQAGTDNPIEKAVAEVVEDICPTGVINVVDLQDRCNEIVGEILGAGDVSGAQDGLLGMGAEENSVVEAGEVDLSGGSLGDVSDRQLNLRVNRGSATTIALDIDGQQTTNAIGTNAGDSLSFENWGMFFSGSFGTGDKDETQRSSGFDFDTYNITVGADYWLQDDVVLGAAVGYQNFDADINANGGEASLESINLLAYASFFPSNHTYLDVTAGYTFSNIDQERAIRYSIAGTNVNQTAFSDTDGNELLFRVSGGYDFYYDNWTYGPYASIEYARVDIDGFQETIPTAGAGSGLAVQIDDQDFTSVPLTLGVQARTELDTSWGTLMPQLSAEYVREFANDEDFITGHFLGDTSQTKFRLPTDTPDRNVFNIGIALHALYGHGGSASIGYQTMLGHKDLTVHLFTAEYRLLF